MKLKLKNVRVASDCCTNSDEMMLLDFEVQQVAVDLVVDVRVVLLLAQVQPGNVHGGLRGNNGTEDGFQ